MSRSCAEASLGRAAAWLAIATIAAAVVAHLLGGEPAAENLAVLSFALAIAAALLPRDLTTLSIGAKFAALGRRRRRERRPQSEPW
jgi:fermentation-respiration switch protein FrsA (DUF1100 family)